MTNAADFLEADAASEPPAVAGSGACGSTVQIYDVRGEVWISWNIAFQAKMPAWVALYEGTPPSDPNGSGKAWGGKQVNGPSGSYNTGKSWGPGWTAGLFGQGWYGGYTYIAQTPVSGS